MQNPFTKLNKIIVDDNHIEITYMNIPKYFKHAYVLVKKSSYIPPEIYNAELSEELYYKISNHLILKKVSLNILKIKSHMQAMTIITKSYLDIFNIFDYELDHYNAVIPILNIEYSKIETYLNNYNPVSTLENIYNSIIFDTFFQIKKHNVIKLI